MIVQEVKLVVLTTNVTAIRLKQTIASKGLATGVLLVLIITVIVALIIFIVIGTQTGFIENTAKFLSDLLSLPTP